MIKILFSKYINSPIGYLHVQSNDCAVTAISFSNEKKENSSPCPEILNQATKQLYEYFNGSRNEFQLPLNPEGTEFQKMIWNYIQEVGYGQTSSYLNIAIKSGSKTNTRAVGMANGKNPIPIIIPCHRIVGSNGKLTGYAGGLDKKRWLLHHEMLFSPKPNQLF